MIGGKMEKNGAWVKNQVKMNNYLQKIGQLWSQEKAALS